MKKITLLAVAALAISFASCKKDRVCTCTTASSNGTYVHKTTYFKVKKKMLVFFVLVTKLKRLRLMELLPGTKQLVS